MKIRFEAQTERASLVRRDDERAHALDQLQRLVDESLASGSAEAFDLDEFLARKQRTCGSDQE